ncbi:MAG: VPLPA-CTERM sorting domain-containing protein [Steroidobacteraceae bacterium]
MKHVWTAALLVGAIAVSQPSVGRADAVLVPTGGTLGGVTPATVSANYGSFAATQTQQIFILGPEQTASVGGNYSPTGVTIAATATTYYAPVPPPGPAPTTGAASGVIGFDLTSAAAYSFNWSQNTFSNQQPLASLKLTTSGGSVVLGCIGQFGMFGVPGGCELGAVPTDPRFAGPLALYGLVQLPAGQYDLSFAVSSTYDAGNPVNSDFTFSLSPPVPLPASAWLMLSGLVGVGAFARKGLA